MRIKSGMEVHLGLDYAYLKGRIDEEHVGHMIHVGFMGWTETNAGQPCRRFEVYAGPFGP